MSLMIKHGSKQQTAAQRRLSPQEQINNQYLTSNTLILVCLQAEAAAELSFSTKEAVQISFDPFDWSL